jgi:tRNA(Ile)-lysidine synthase
MKKALEWASFVSQSIPEDVVEAKVTRYLQGLLSDKKIGIAVSGGPDSLFLGLWFWGQYPELRERSIWLHFNHHIRGEAADRDEAFVKEIASDLRIPLHVGHREPGLPANEAQLRDSRYNFFKKIALEEGLSAILLGHHADDAFETMVMRMVRGSGAAGLASPKPVRFEGDLAYLRPLLRMDKKQILSVLNDAQIPYCQDDTNELPCCLRNQWRPILQKLKDGFGQQAPWNVAYTRERLEEDDGALESILNEFLAKKSMSILPRALHFESFTQLPKALKRRLLHRYLNQFGLSLEGKSLEGCVACLDEAKSLRQPLKKGFLIYENQILQWVEPVSEALPWPSVPLLEGGAVALPDGNWVALNPICAEDECKVFPGAIECVAPLPNVLLVRNWRFGDRYQAKGAPGCKKLSDHFVDHKVPRSKRHSFPVVCGADGAIFWVPGLRLAHKISDFSPICHALRLTYRQEKATINSSLNEKTT